MNSNNTNHAIALQKYLRLTFPEFEPATFHRRRVVVTGIRLNRV